MTPSERVKRMLERTDRERARLAVRRPAGWRGRCAVLSRRATWLSRRLETERTREWIARKRSQPVPGERVRVEFTDGTVGELPPWPTDAELAARDAWIDEQLAKFPLDLSQGMP